MYPSKPAYLSDFPDEEAGRLIYVGHYHFTGRVLEGELCRDSNWNENNTMDIDNFTFGFSDDLAFVPKGLQDPILQLSFEAKIPWILDGKL